MWCINEQREKEETNPSPSFDGNDEGSPQGGFLPCDVRRRILEAVPGGGEGSAFAREKREVEFLKEAGFRIFEKPQEQDIYVRGKEHSVVFSGERVRKYLTETALVPAVSGGLLEVRRALPSEYLERLELMNDHFLDDVRIEGILKNGEFVTSQSLLKGGEPSESEISDFLDGLGWRRISANQQRLPHNLMATAWVHQEGGIVMIDARPPNFKKTDLGVVLPIDLMLANATGALLAFVESL